MTQSPRRSDFKVFRSIQTRWLDHDDYGHVNNVEYYSYFDTAVNGFLIAATGTDIRRLPSIGIVAETSCRFVKAVEFPDVLAAGLRVERIGTSSVIYQIALFREHDEEPCAIGRFVHVYVDQTTRRPSLIPSTIREALEALRPVFAPGFADGRDATTAVSEPEPDRR
jgi:acyl-CoA thioester hydrolase